MHITALLRQHGFFILLFCFAAVLRLAPLFEYQFTYDEISALQRTGFRSFGELVEKGIRIDAHPALLQTIIFYMVKWFGYSTWVVKLPFILLNIASLPYVYAFCRRNFSQEAAINATVIFGFSLACMYYAPIARMYGCGIFFSAALLFHFYEIVFHDRRRLLHYLMFVLFMWLSAMNHHMNALFAASVYLSGFFYLDRSQIKRYLAAGAVAVLFYAPHLPVTIYQLGVGGIGVEQGGWLEPPGISVFPDLLNVLCGAGYGLGVMLALTVMAGLGGRQAMPRGTMLLPALFLFNFCVIFFYSLFRAPIYQHSLLLFSGTGFLLFLASLLSARNPLISRLISGLLLIWLLWQTFVRKDFYRQTVKTVFEYQFERTAELKKDYGERLHPAFFDADTVMQRIFSEKYDARYMVVLSSSPELSSNRAFCRFVDTTRAEYIALASSQPLQQSLVRDRFPYLVERSVTHAIHYKVYSRDEKDRTKIIADDDTRTFWANRVTPPFKYPATVLPAPVDPVNEYPYHISARYIDIIPREGVVILAEASIESGNSPSGIECCISVTDERGGLLHYNAGTILRRNFSGMSSNTVRAQLFIGNLHHKSKLSHRINIYVWNRARERFILRDLTVKVVDHWPQKWHFWD